MDTARKLTLKGPSTPAGALAGAAVASLLAGILVFSALKAGSEGGDAPVASAAPVSVIVADRLIPKGSPGEAIAAGQIAQPTDVRDSEVSAGAITDIDELRGQVATHDIFPGEQLSAADFTAAGASTLTTKLTGSVRGISVPLDSAHGMIGQAQPGDHVDVYASFQTRNKAGDEVPILKPLATNVEVLKTPKPETDGNSNVNASSTELSVVTLRMVGRKAAQLAFAADAGKVWLVLRPPTGAVENSSKLVTLQTLLNSGRTGITGAAVESADDATAGASSGKAAATGESNLPQSAPFEDLEQTDPFGDVTKGSKTTSTKKGK